MSIPALQPGLQRRYKIAGWTFGIRMFSYCLVTTGLQQSLRHLNSPRQWVSC